MSLTKAGPITRLLSSFVAKNHYIRTKLYEIGYFPQLGLMYDDCLAFDHPFVNEAIARLPKDIREERQFRIIRATTLSAQQKVLPKSEWMTYDKDERYLTPFIVEIRSEQEQKAEMAKYKYAYRSTRDRVLERKLVH